ncbi:MAG: UDP-3-O-(3-hydroxymyristoyl)glucosamine N-acyltransferase [Spirochaetes bacterium]|nr:UDP-3-O-(3-hydroxymyristoyl)glucosamine N-acyltransferase [Spirochaetota bacterium]
MYTVGEIADKLGGSVKGDAESKVKSICTPEELIPGSVVFIKKKKWYDEMEKSVKPLCVVVDFEPNPVAGYEFVVIQKERQEEAFIALLEMFHKKWRAKEGISSLASVDPGAEVSESAAIDRFVTIGARTRIGEGTSVGAGSVIGPDCTIGKNCLIYPNVTIYPNTVMGNDVIVHSGVVIGSDGFSYSRIHGSNRKVPQIGGVLIEDNVEIGANTTIDSATIGYTKIGENTKIDNLVQIAHNVVIGKDSIVCALCGVSGSVSIGDNVVLAGQVGLADHIVIEDDVLVGAKSGVMTKRVKRGEKLLGYPATSYQKQLKSWALAQKLPELNSDIQKIKKKLGNDT